MFGSMELQPTFIPKALIEQTLTTKAETGKRLLQPLKDFSIGSNISFHILEDVEIENPPEVHMHEADLWIGIEGEVTFIVGGKLIDERSQINSDGVINENEKTGLKIEGGAEYIVRAGDVLHIPAGVPHLHKAKGVARMHIIKIPRI